MPRPKIHEERTMMVKRIIDLVKEHGRFLSKDIAELLGGGHRKTAEIYLRTAVEQRQSDLSRSARNLK